MTGANQSVPFTIVAGEITECLSIAYRISTGAGAGWAARMAGIVGGIHL